MQDFTREFENLLDKAVEHALSDTDVEAYRLSSGPYSLPVLASLDYPYATRHGVPQLDPKTINVQTGEFRDSWMRHKTATFAGMWIARIVNASPVADFLQYGTRFMFARPIKTELEEYAESELQKRIGQAVSAFQKRTYK